MEELKPCPFCKGQAKLLLQHEESFPTVHCEGCNAETSVRFGKVNAVAEWNTRPIEDALYAENAALKAQVAEAAKGPITLSEALLADAFQSEIDALQSKVDALMALVAALEAREEARIEHEGNHVRCAYAMGKYPQERVEEFQAKIENSRPAKDSAIAAAREARAKCRALGMEV